MTYVIQITHTEEGTVQYYAPDGPSGGYPYKTHLGNAFSFATIEDAYSEINDNPSRSFFHGPFEKVEICELLVAPVTAAQIAEIDDKTALDVYRTLTRGQRESILELLTGME